MRGKNGKLSAESRVGKWPSREAAVLCWLRLTGAGASGVEEETLRGRGVGARDIARLVSMGWVRRATAEGAQVVLTAAGAVAADEALANFAELGMFVQVRRAEVGPVITPSWDAARLELSYGGVVVKRCRRAAPNQTAILAAFEADGWPFRIADPLPPQGGLAASERLRDTLRWLNRDLPRRLRFYADGTGQGVYWQETASPEDAANAGSPSVGPHAVCAGSNLAIRAGPTSRHCPQP